MCGIIGFLDKRSSLAPIGTTMLGMLRALSCRGPDSAGVAFFAPPQDHWTMMIPQAPGIDASILREVLSTEAIDAVGSYLVAQIAPVEDPIAFERQLTRRLPNLEIVSMGHSLTIVKEVGSPDNLEAQYELSSIRGSHFIGHTRLSTESKVDLSHSQPFWCHGVPDVATVHNGHVTNYHKLRRQYEQRGYRFYTENDSEVIGVYLRDRMAAGLSFDDALHSAIDDLDGSFCFLAATGDRLAYVRDRFGFKPLVVAETDDFVAIATEEVAIRRAIGRDFPAAEPDVGSVRIWKTSAMNAVGV